MAGFLSIHPAFLLLLAFLFYRDSSGVTLLAVLACMLHELGHIIVLLWQRHRINRISFTPFGLSIELGSTLSYPQELCAAAAGPLVNLGLAWFGSHLPDWTCFVGVNLALGAFNLLPLGELDGARILYAFLALCGFDCSARKLCGFLEGSLSLFLLVVGCILVLRFQNPSLLLTVLWLSSRHLPKIKGNFKKKNRIRACQKITKPLK